MSLWDYKPLANLEIGAGEIVGALYGTHRGSVAACYLAQALAPFHLVAYCARALWLSLRLWLSLPAGCAAGGFLLGLRWLCTLRSGSGRYCFGRTRAVCGGKGCGHVCGGGAVGGGCLDAGRVAGLAAGVGKHGRFGGRSGAGRCRSGFGFFVVAHYCFDRAIFI